ncbi:FIST signal transduction protein [Rubricoccus marinus]|uniref:Histidine kinase n=1 Tax=Rubricoccus marinus TaxID=716817 RepID=A0A259U2W7_9BACT|nr:FIST N-terminal domain-containing protein [Rubricoccus marinus]OZC04286.1 hypothetical protein BSZ36_15635 [Rubricoccus marinus]
MHTTRWSWIPGTPVAPESEPADLVFAFGSTELISDPRAFAAVRARYPHARILGAASGGEISGDRVSDGSLVTAAVTFGTSTAEVVSVPLVPGETADETGRRLGALVAPRDPDGQPLAHVFVLADGIALNGSALARGLESALPSGTKVTGGLAADGERFERTPIWADTPLEGPGAAALALYGENLRVGSSAVGGWDTFGPRRVVTRSEGNVLYELDGRSAFDLYCEYLGPYAADLPASGLLFPLSIQVPGSDYVLVRTVLNVDREAGTITFAGDIPHGATAQLMRTSHDRLVDGAASATELAADMLGQPAELALIVSCVGRRWAMGPRIEEEVEEASSVFGAAACVGFYSYGELAPVQGNSLCELHNQTMTVTALAEA